MPYTVQPLNYDFIGQAGAILGSSIQQYPEAEFRDRQRKQLEETLKNNKIDYAQAEQAREQRITEMGIEYLEATGGSAQDEEALKRATTLAMQFVPPLMGEERTNPAKGIMRIHDSDEPRWDKFIQKTKVEKYRKASQPTEEPVAGTLAGTQAGRVGVEDQGTQRATAWPTSKEAMVQGARTESMTAPPVVPSVQSAPTSQERRRLAGQMGITDIPEVKSDIQQQEGVEAGEAWQPGQVKEQFLAGQAAAGRDVTGGAAKEIGGAMQTTQQVATNERLKIQEDQRSKLRMTLARMQDARDRSKNVDKNTLKLLDTQIRAVQAQIDASKSRSDIALGLKTGKDPFEGTTIYSTGKEWETEYADAESTYESANRLLDYVDQLNRKVNPIPGGMQPATKPAVVRKPLSAFER